MEPISRRTADAIVTAFQNEIGQPNPGQHQIYKPGERGPNLLPAMNHNLMSRLTADPCPACFGAGRAISALLLVQAVSHCFHIPMIIKPSQKGTPVRAGPPEEEFVPGSAAPVLIIDNKCNKGHIGHMTYGGMTCTGIWELPPAVGLEAEFAQGLCGTTSRDGGDDRDGGESSDMEVGSTPSTMAERSLAVLRMPVADLRAKPWYALTYRNRLDPS